ncbi:MAG: hypothetical protein U1F76_06735 [Candidatus Competibacteraceae bacterium]
MSASTLSTPMTTSDPGLTAVSAPASVQDVTRTPPAEENLSATMAALLNPMVIARMANEFFSALPGSPAPPSTTLPPVLSAPPATIVASAPPATPPFEVGALPAAPAIPPASALTPPTEAELRPLPATVKGATGLPVPVAAPDPAAPLGPYEFRPELVPGQLFASPPVSPPSAPSASVLSSSTPATPPVEMGVLPATPAAPSTTAFAAPTEAELRALPATLAGTTEILPTATGVEPASAASGSSFYFLEMIQSTPHTTPAFAFEPYGFDPAMLPDLSLVAGPYERLKVKG